MIDTYRHKGLRKKLVTILDKKLKEVGVEDSKILDAINEVPRHFFLDSAFDEIAYEDRAFPIDAQQTISQPFTVAFQSHLLQINKYEKVLEIGTGSAYQTCILAALGAKVFTIERQKLLFEKIKNFKFKSTYPSIKFFYGDGFEGLPTFAPFDKILITAAAPKIPEKLFAQLKVGGNMVLPLNNEADDLKSQLMIRITKLSATEMRKEVFDKFSFVPMLSGKAK